MNNLAIISIQLYQHNMHHHYVNVVSLALIPALKVCAPDVNRMVPIFNEHGHVKKASMIEIKKIQIRVHQRIAHEMDQDVVQVKVFEVVVVIQLLVVVRLVQRHRQKLLVQRKSVVIH